MRTRVGYAGGTTPDPTYRRIGDHAESIQVDYDPERVSYEDLIEMFWCAHRPSAPPWSTQYMSAVFWEGDEQRAVTERTRDRVESATGQRVHTLVAPLGRFYVAEDYHQKYRLRRERDLMREFAEVFGDEAAFRDSTATARCNGFLDGYGELDLLQREIDTYGLTEHGRKRLLSASEGLSGASVRCES